MKKKIWLSAKQRLLWAALATLNQNILILYLLIVGFWLSTEKILKSYGWIDWLRWRWIGQMSDYGRRNQLVGWSLEQMGDRCCIKIAIPLKQCDHRARIKQKQQLTTYCKYGYIFKLYVGTMQQTTAI